MTLGHFWVEYIQQIARERLEREKETAAKLEAKNKDIGEAEAF